MITDQIPDQTRKRRRLRLRYAIPAVLVVPLAAAVVLAVVAAGSDASIRLSGDGLATVSTPFGSGSVTSVSAVGGREQKDIPVALRGREVWPTQKVQPGERITVVATVKRPGWISWLAGSSERVTLTEVAPVARVASTFITHAAGQPLKVKFREPVSVVGSGPVGTHVEAKAVSASQTSLTVSSDAVAGTVAVAAAVRSWERPSTTDVSWFPRGKQASAVASPAPGSTITASTDITLTFSKSVKSVLGTHMPPVTPITPGVWHTVNARTIVFKPTGTGYGFGATVKVLLPASVYLIGSSQTSTSTAGTTTATAAAVSSTAKSSAYPVVGTWTVPQPSTLVLQEMLAELGYLPLKFTPAATTTTPATTTAPATTTTATGTTTAATGTTTAATGTTTAATGTTATAPVATTTTGALATVPTSAAANAGNGFGTTIAQVEASVTNPPKGTLSWRYPHTPGQLKALWSPTKWTELTKGAVMAFESTMGMTVDGDPGPQVWKELVKAVADDDASQFGYTFVMVSEALPEQIHVWHNGKIVVHGLANTGIPAAPTALGTYAVYERFRVTTMSGLNPNGTPYHDTGIPYVSYFNGGDALHGFIRASYGFPQSLGCVEMPFAEAGQVWPYTPIGTIVNLTASKS